MRINSGIYKGRLLSVPKGDAVRPTGDKMRQALFNILQSYSMPVDAHVLDIFCGTGALGLEALSRGAAHAVFMDTDTAPCAANIKALKAEDHTSLLRRDATKPARSTGTPATLLFADPPYQKNLLAPALTALAQNGWLAPAALCACEVERDHAGDIPPGFALLDRRDYGAACLLLLRHAG